jgi:hypothetical protein
MKLSDKKRQAAYNAVAEHVDRLRVKLRLARKERRDVAALAESELQFLALHIFSDLREALNIE